MKAKFIFTIAILTGLAGSSWVSAQNEITGGDVRAVLDGKYALTSEGYAQYRKCIADTPLGGTMETYNAALAECKKQAKESAFLISPKDPIFKPNPINGTGSGSSGIGNANIQRDNAINLDRAWQGQVFTK